MSLPTWAKMPVIGAMKPMRSSSDCAGAASAAPNAIAAKTVTVREPFLVIFDPPEAAEPPPRLDYAKIGDADLTQGPLHSRTRATLA